MGDMIINIDKHYINPKDIVNVSGIHIADEIDYKELSFRIEVYDYRNYNTKNLIVLEYATEGKFEQKMTNLINTRNKLLKYEKYFLKPIIL